MRLLLTVVWLGFIYEFFFVTSTSSFSSTPNPAVGGATTHDEHVPSSINAKNEYGSTEDMVRTEEYTVRSTGEVLPHTNLSPNTPVSISPMTVETNTVSPSTTTTDGDNDEPESVPNTTISAMNATVVPSLTPLQATFQALTTALRTQEQGYIHRKVLDEEGMKLRTIWSIVLDTFHSYAANDPSTTMATTTQGEKVKKRPTLSILDELQRIEELVLMRLSLEKGIEINEQRYRADEQRSPLPTAVPRVYEQSRVTIEPKSLPKDVWELWEQQQLNQTTDTVNRKSSSSIQSKAPLLTKSGVQITLLPSSSSLPSGTDGKQRSTTITTTGPSPSDYLRSQIKLLLLHIHALLLTKLHGIGVIEDYQGKIIRTFSPSLDEYLRSDLGTSVFDGDETNTRSSSLHASMDETLVNLRELLNTNNHPRSSSSSPSSTSNMKKSFQDKSSATDKDEDNTDDKELKDDSSFWFDLGIATWNSETFKKAAGWTENDYVSPERAMMNEQYGIEKNKPDTKKPASSKSSVTKPKLPSGSILLDPVDVQRKYGSNGKGRKPGSIEWRQHTGLLSPILNARDPSEGRQIFIIRILQLGGLIVSPVRGIYEILKLSFHGIRYLFTTWIFPFPSSPVIRALPVDIIETEDDVIVQSKIPTFSDSVVDTLLYYFYKYGSIVWSYIRIYILSPVYSIFRYFHLPWAWSIVWSTGEYVIWDSIFPPLDSNYHRPEVVACEQVLDYIHNLQNEIQGMYNEASYHIGCIDEGLTTTAETKEKEKRNKRTIQNSTVHLPVWKYTHPVTDELYDYLHKNRKDGSFLNLSSLLPYGQLRSYAQKLVDYGTGTLSCERDRSTTVVELRDTPGWSLLQYNPFLNHSLSSSSSSLRSLLSSSSSSSSSFEHAECYTMNTTSTNASDPLFALPIHFCPFRSITIPTIGKVQWIGWELSEKCLSVPPSSATFASSSPPSASSVPPSASSVPPSVPQQQFLWQIENMIEQIMYLPVTGIYKGICSSDPSLPSSIDRRRDSPPSSFSSSSSSSSSFSLSNYVSSFFISSRNTNKNDRTNMDYSKATDASVYDLTVHVKFLCGGTDTSSSSSSSLLPLLRYGGGYRLTRCAYEYHILTPLACSKEQTRILYRLQDILSLLNESEIPVED